MISVPDVPIDDEPPDSEPESEPARKGSFLHPRAASGRLTIATIVGGFATLLTPSSVALHVRAMVGWDAGALTFIVLAWMLIARASPEETRRRAAFEDPGRRIVFLIAITSSVFSLAAAVNVMRAIGTLPPAQASVWSALGVAAVVLSWFVTHTAFTLRYAHLFYRRHGVTLCLRFEGTDQPCDMDFAYFAFTIGMCFQVSDVVIMSSRVRRAVLIHALLSFGYNTTILALALNLVTKIIG
jgi:uncharacterized membrane protein